MLCRVKSSDLVFRRPLGTVGDDSISARLAVRGTRARYGIGPYNLNSSPVLQPSAGGQCPPLQVFSRRRSRRATESKLSTLMKNSTKKEGATMKQCKRHLTDREVFWLAMAAAAVAWLLL